MKKYTAILLTAAAMLAAVVSCSKNIEKEAPVEEPGVEIVPEGLVKVVITAESAQTRASLSGEDVLWSAGDQIAVHDGTDLRCFELVSGAGTSTGSFEGYVEEGATTLKALFPYSAGTWNGSSFDYAIPDFQDVASQSIDPMGLIATGTGTVSGGLTFSNAPALLRFTVGAGVTQVIFHTLDGEHIAGASTSVVVALPGDAGTYEAAINPGTYAGFRAFVTNGSGTFKKESATALTLAASKGKNMGTLAPTDEVIAIATPAELEAFLGGSPTLDAYLCKDLDLSASTPGTLASYAGVFDGQGHVLNNWAASAALFGTLSGSIIDLTIGASCTMGNPASGNFGYLVNELTGSMTACVNRADIDVTLADVSEQYVFGSLVGCSNAATSVMTDCENYGAIDIDFAVPASGTMQPQFLGGLVGKVGAESTESTTRMDGCVNHGDHLAVTASSGGDSVQEITMVGGIAGAAGITAGVESTLESGFTLCYGKFDGCVNHADVSVVFGGGSGRGFKVGGIAGTAECILSACTNDGDVSLTNSDTNLNNNPAIGGIAGVLCGPATGHNAENCTNSGTVTFTGRYGNGGTANGYAAGHGGTYYNTAGGCFGVVGDNTTSIYNCDNYGFIDFTPNGTNANSSRLYMGGVAGRCVAAMDGCDNLYTGATPQEISSSTMRYCYLGGVAGLCSNASISNCNNSADINFSRPNRAGQTVALQDYVGGVAGIANSATSISNCSNAGNLVYDHPTASTGGTRIAGVVGSASVALTVSSCTNTGTITYTGQEEYVEDAGIYIAGVLAYDTKALTMSNCSNTAALTYNGGDVSTNAVWLGGVLGYAGASFTMTGCSNEGDLTASGWSREGNNYIGGVYGGGYGTVSTIEDCTNEGDIAVTSGSKLHLGGIAGALRGDFNGNVQNAAITASGIAASKVGGVVGYHYFGSIQRSTARRTSVSGTITTTLTASSFTGGISGGSNAASGTNEWGDYDINVTVSNGGANYCGALLGGIVTAAGAGAAKTITVGGTNTYGSTTVNGAAIAAGNLRGYTAKGTFTQTDF